MKIVKKAAALLLMAALICVTAITTGPVHMGTGHVQAPVIHTEPTVEKAASTDTRLARVSVHDPSIVKDVATGTYYVFGSHLATAKSDDLVNWTQILRDYDKVQDNPIYGPVAENLAESFRWAGYKDADCRYGYAVWAPDVYWDDYYVWEDGSRGAYLLYYSASSTWRKSCIGLAVSKSIEGPYTYAATLLYSGFTTSGTPEPDSTIDTKWDNDYLNFASLIKKGPAKGGISDISEKWFKVSSYNNNYAPNAIDPTVIAGADGALYLVYGSWSGGLFLLEVDPETGLVIYPGEDGEDASGNFVDRYFGVHLAGANHQSGEGAFILWDEETGYYYLYETYGGLFANGGYNMRLFRSENITGPYLDAAGQNAADNGKGDNAKYGIKLIGNYRFEGQPGYRSAGHNSALIDGDGSRYLIYHQRFDGAGERHEVRVHQQFMNEDGWPVTAVYENRNEGITTYDPAQVAGTYEFINHGRANSTGMLETLEISLDADGSVNGAVNGTWMMSDSGKNYNYLTIQTDDGVIYKGVFFHQKNDNGVPCMTFSCIGDNNESIWGSKED